MANLLNWLGRDVVAPIRRDVLNPIGNVANQVYQPVQQAASGLVHTGENIATAPYSGARLAAADITNNQIARQNAIRALQTSQHAAGGLLQWPGSAVGSIGATVLNKPTFTPTNSLERFLAGNHPTPSIQGAYDIARNHGQSIPSAITQGGLQALSDLPVGLKGIKLAKDVGVPAAKSIKVYDAAQNQVGAVGKNVKLSPAPPVQSPKTPLIPVAKVKSPAGQGTKLRAVPETIKGSQALQANTPISPKELNTTIKSIPYLPRPQPGVLEKAVNEINANPVNELNKALQRSPTQLTDKEVAKRYVLIADNLHKGNAEVAAQLSKTLAPAGTELGRAVSMFNVINRTTPSGAFHWANKLGADSGVAKGFYDRATKIAEMAEGNNKLIAKGQLAQDIMKLQPSTNLDKAFGVWRAGLLTGPRTVSKIIASHGVHLPLELAKNLPANAIDKAVSLVSGKRSMALTGKGIGTGFKTGASSGKTYLTKGVNLQAGGVSDFHRTFQYGNSAPAKVVGAYVNGIGRLHGSFYQPFYGAEHLNSLYSSAIAEAKNAGLKGAKRDSFVQKFVNSPPKWAADTAEKEAQVATFQQKTTLGTLATTLQQKGGVIGRAIAPFTRVPSAIATDIFHYSPAGAAKAVIDATKAARSDTGWTLTAQRQFSQEIGRSIVGTGALIPGLVLYQKGLMNLQYPASDPVQQKLWAAEGRTANSVKVGGKWRSLGSLGPAGSILEIGGYIGDSLSKGNSWGQSLIAGLGGGVKSVEEQPYVQGVSGAINAVQEPGRYIPNLEKQYAKSAVPTGVAQLATTQDKNQRQVNTPGEAVKSAIPGLRESLPVKTDAFGNPLPSPETGPGALIDPFYSSKARPSSPLISELQRLHDTGQGTMPSSQPQKNSFDGVKTVLTKPQTIDLQNRVGKTAQDLWNQTISFSGYQNLTDEQKHQMLSNILSDTTSATKSQYAAQNNLGKFSPDFTGTAKPLTAKQQAIIDGNFDPASYLPKLSTAKIPKAKTAKAPKTGSRKVSSRSSGRKASGKALTTKFKTASLSKVTKPKGITVKKLAAPSFKTSGTRKLAVSKIPSNYLSKKLA